MFWYIIAAVVVSTVALIAALIVLPKWVADSFEHGNACNCNACMRRRMQKWDRLNEQKHNRKEVTLLNTTDMVSTRELSTNDVVTSAETNKESTRYTVRDLVIRDYGWVVILVNRRTDQVAWVRVSNDRLDIPIWRRFQIHRKGHVTGL